MIKPSFLKSAFLYTLGGGLPVLGGIILLPFYANLLTPPVFLQLSFYISISLFVQIFYSFSLDTYFGIHYARLKAHQPDNLPAFISRTGIWTWGLGIFWSLIFLLLGPNLFPLIFREDLNMHFGTWAVLSVITGFFNAGIRNVLQILLYEQKTIKHFFLNVLNFILTLVLGIYGVYHFPDSPAGPVWARFLSAGIVFFAGHPFLFPERKIFSVLEGWADAFRFCVPYFFFVLGSWGLLQADRYLLQYHLSSTDLNAYDLLQKCFFAMEFFHNTLSSILFPVLFTYWSKEQRVFTSEETNRYFHVFTALNIVILPFFNACLPFIYQGFIQREYFFDALDFLGLMACWYAFRPLANYYLAAFLYSRKIYSLTGIFLTGAFFQLALVYFLAGSFGLKAALYAGLFARIVQCFMMHLILSKYNIHFKYNPFKMIGLPSLFTILSIMVFLKKFTQHTLIWFSIFSLFSILVLGLFRKEIKTTLFRYKDLLASRFFNPQG